MRACHPHLVGGGTIVNMGSRAGIRPDDVDKTPARRNAALGNLDLLEDLPDAVVLVTHLVVVGAVLLLDALQARETVYELQLRRQLVVEPLGIRRRREIAVVAAPVGQRPGHAVDQLANAGLPVRPPREAA